MNGIHLNGKPRRHDKPVPGCLGRMVNLFDMTSLSGNHLLTDKPHNDGSLSRSQSDVSVKSIMAIDKMKDKVTTSELRRSLSSKKSSGTPVKMLIAQEMSKDLQSSHTHPNVVAKLMGLDAALGQQPDLASQRSHAQCYMQNCYSEQPFGYWQGESGLFNNQIDCEVNLHRPSSEYKDIYEVWQQTQRTNCIKDKSPHKGRNGENVNEKKLALIRQKFMEAKRLATDEKLRQTKEFQEALDILSANGDLFLKVLQEPNSLFSQHLYVGQSIFPSPDTKRITVLKPSKMLVVDDKFARRNEKQLKKQSNFWDNSNGFSPTMSTWKPDDMLSQPTRIVVLKPSTVKVNDVKAVVSPTPSSPHTLLGESFLEEIKDGGAKETREVTKEIAETMRENISGHRRDETLLSSVFSNGYTGDESSFEKSDNESAAGNLSDSELMSPTSRHSWDYINRFGSPSSSFSRASYSPRSSVCREAKKRLSERWALMASNGNNVEQRHNRRSSSTLGEMLALSEINKLEICEEEDTGRDKDLRTSTSSLNSDIGVKESGDDSPRSFQRSKSLPVSSTACGEQLNVQVSDPVLQKEGASKKMMKTKSSKTSFTGKVTSLFFSRNKKSRKEKSSHQQLGDESPRLATAETPGTSDDPSEVGLPPTSRLLSETVKVDLRDENLGEGVSSQQEGFCASESSAARNQGENPDQPSPISVLESPFEEDESTIPGCSLSIEPNLYGNQMLLSSSKSNLIDKSPPIGSISRTLSWEESYADTCINYHLSSPYVYPRAKDDKTEWLFLVQTLLSMAGIDNEEQLISNLARWHSSISPLDPMLREKYIDLSAREPLHEAKRRQLRSNRKLVFDCVNAALVDITGMGTPASQWTGPPVMIHIMDDGSTELAQKVWAWMGEWFSGEVKLYTDDGGDNNSLVERVVRKEVVGKGWIEQSKLEMDNIGNEVERKLLEELVEEYVVEFTGRG